MLTDAVDVSENSEAFVCLVEDASGQGTLYNSAVHLMVSCYFKYNLKTCKKVFIEPFLVLYTVCIYFG